MLLGGYDRRFIDGFASISSPLRALTQKKVKFEWSKTCEKGFQELKDKVTFAPMLNLPEGYEKALWCIVMLPECACDMSSCKMAK